MTEQNEIEITIKHDEVKDVNGVDAALLRSYIDRVERLEEEKKALSNDIKEVFEEAKCNKIDVSGLRKILQMRKMDEQDRQELDFIVEQYKTALGMAK